MAPTEGGGETLLCNKVDMKKFNHTRIIQSSYSILMFQIESGVSRKIVYSTWSYSFNKYLLNAT